MGRNVTWTTQCETPQACSIQRHLYGNSFYEIKDSDDPTTNIVDDVPITDDSYKELFNYYPMNGNSDIKLSHYIEDGKTYDLNCSEFYREAGQPPSIHWYNVAGGTTQETTSQITGKYPENQNEGSVDLECDTANKEWGLVGKYCEPWMCNTPEYIDNANDTFATANNVNGLIRMNIPVAGADQPADIEAAHSRTSLEIQTQPTRNTLVWECIDGYYLQNPPNECILEDNIKTNKYSIEPCIPMECTIPSSAASDGYDFPATTVNIDNVNQVTCDTGYVGTPSITLCSENNTDLQVSGCYPLTSAMQDAIVDALDAKNAAQDAYDATVLAKSDAETAANDAQTDAQAAVDAAAAAQDDADLAEILKKIMLKMQANDASNNVTGWVVGNAVVTPSDEDTQTAYNAYLNAQTAANNAQTAANNAQDEATYAQADADTASNVSTNAYSGTLTTDLNITLTQAVTDAEAAKDLLKLLSSPLKMPLTIVMLWLRPRTHKMLKMRLN